MKTIFSLLCVFTLFSTGIAQKGARIEFNTPEATVDFGKVSKGTDDGIRTLEFRNTGDKPLIISDVKSTCGCTVPSKPTEPIMPGQTGKIEVKYNMNPGPIRKTITIQSNAVNYDNGSIPVKVIGEVIVQKEVNLLEKKKVGPMK